MSDYIPTKPYIYQPYGLLGNQNPGDLERLYAIGGLPNGCTIDGLLKPEANAILDVVISLGMKP